MATQLQLPRLGASRRAFLRLFVAAASGAVALQPRQLTGLAASPGDEILMRPTNPGPAGPFGADQLRAKAAALAPARSAVYLDSANCWSQVANDIYVMSRAERQAALSAFFSDFAHGGQLADFVFSLSEVNFSHAAALPPSPADVAALDTWVRLASRDTSTPDRFAEKTAGLDVRRLGQSLQDVSQFSLLLSWERGQALPKAGSEFQEQMVIAAEGVAIYAFGRASEQLLPIVRSERGSQAIRGASLAASAVELVLGGLQSIAYQNALGRRSEAVRLARLAAAGFLLLGRSHAGDLVFSRVERLAGGSL